MLVIRCVCVTYYIGCKLSRVCALIYTLNVLMEAYYTQYTHTHTHIQVIKWHLHINITKLQSFRFQFLSLFLYRTRIHTTIDLSSSYFAQQHYNAVSCSMPNNIGLQCAPTHPTPESKQPAGLCTTQMRIEYQKRFMYTRKNFDQNYTDSHICRVRLCIEQNSDPLEPTSTIHSNTISRRQTTDNNMFCVRGDMWMDGYGRYTGSSQILLKMLSTVATFCIHVLRMCKWAPSRIHGRSVQTFYMATTVVGKQQQCNANINLIHSENSHKTPKYMCYNADRPVRYGSTDCLHTDANCSYRQETFQTNISTLAAHQSTIIRSVCQSDKMKLMVTTAKQHAVRQNSCKAHPRDEFNSSVTLNGNNTFGLINQTFKSIYS